MGGSGGCAAVAASTSSRRSRSSGFIVLFLHDERGFSPALRPAVLAAIQVLAAVLRIGSGPLVGHDRLAGCARCGLSGSGAALRRRSPRRCLDAPLGVLVPAFVLAGGFRWRGTGSLSRPPPSSPAAAEAARRSGCSRRRSRWPAALVRRGVRGDRRRDVVAGRLRRWPLSSRSSESSYCGRSARCEPRVLRVTGSRAAGGALRDRRRTGCQPARGERAGGRGARAGRRLDARGWARGRAG